MRELVGKLKWQIETPAFVVDLSKLERNISKMAEFFKSKPANVRPHWKTPKTVEIAKMQLEAGARGMTCAKVSEAEVLVAAGIQDILIANEVVGESKIAKLVDLNRTADVKCAVDDAIQIEALSRAARTAGVTLGVLVDVFVGLPRCGVRPENAAELARAVHGAEGLDLRGAMAYEGHVVILEDPYQRETEAKKSMSMLVHAVELIKEAGLPCDIVSGGGTGTYDVSGTFPGITEIQAGSYCLMDVKYAKIQPWFEKAASILATVISTAPSMPGWAIADAGTKTMTTELGLPELIGVQDTRVGFLSEEHGHLFTENGDTPLRVGDKVAFHPSHICTTINLHDRMYVCRDDQVVDIWEISGRGKSR